MSQEVLAFEAELSRNYISQLELGEKSPSLRSLYKLCEVLDVPPSSLLQDVELDFTRFSRHLLRSKLNWRISYEASQISGGI